MSAPISPAAKVTVIRFGSLGWAEAQYFFDDQGLKRGEDYLFFSLRNDYMFQHFVPGQPQLVFTNHVNHEFDAGTVAERIKGLNTEAIVIGLYYADSRIKRGGWLDGSIATDHDRSERIPIRIVRAFLQGQPRDKLVAMLPLWIR